MSRTATQHIDEIANRGAESSGGMKLNSHHRSANIDL